MKIRNKAIIAILALLVAPVSFADGDLSRANVQTVVMEMGACTSNPTISISKPVRLTKLC